MTIFEILDSSTSECAYLKVLGSILLDLNFDGLVYPSFEK